MRLVIPIENTPLRDINNFCVNTGFELDVKRKEIVLMEVTKNGTYK